MLAAIGLDRTKVYIANTVPWRPPGNRTPTPAEIATCMPFLRRQIEFVDPKLVVTLGKPAAHTMFDTTEPISRLRGTWRSLEINGKTIPALPTLHPAFLLRQPAQKQLAWRDMLALKSAIRSWG
jgi:DNA polymerase